MSAEDAIAEIAARGYHLALRVGFAFPMDEVITFPDAWVEHYTRQRLMLSDPVIRWVYEHVGAVRWSAITIDDPKQVLLQAQAFGLRYGVAVSHYDGNPDGLRSFASFARSDREFDDKEIALLQEFVVRRHVEMAPPSNMTEAELEALDMVKRGMRLKQIAHELGVTEGAIKQRLKNAKQKLGAQTSAQAAAMASQYNLI